MAHMHGSLAHKSLTKLVAPGRCGIGADAYGRPENLMGLSLVIVGARCRPTGAARRLQPALHCMPAREWGHCVALELLPLCRRTPGRVVGRHLPYGGLYSLAQLIRRRILR
jgi:hypothetical protein